MPVPPWGGGGGCVRVCVRACVHVCERERAGRLGGGREKEKERSTLYNLDPVP